MRRKSTRNAAKKATPEKLKTESPRRSLRHSKRRKNSTSKSSDESEGEAPQNVETIEPTNVEEVTVPAKDNSDDDSIPLAELDTLKIKLRNKSASFKEDTDSDSKPRRCRSQVVKYHELEYNSEDNEEKGEKKGKGKSKSKNKSKIEKSSIIEHEIQTNREISENVQVTPQSPSNDIPVDNETVDASNIPVQNVNQSESQANHIEQESADKVETSNEETTEINEEAHIQKVEDPVVTTEDNAQQTITKSDVETTEEDNEQQNCGGERKHQEEPSEDVENNHEESVVIPEQEPTTILQDTAYQNNAQQKQESFSEPQIEKHVVKTVDEVVESPKDYEKDDVHVDEKLNEKPVEVKEKNMDNEMASGQSCSVESKIAGAEDNVKPQDNIKINRRTRRTSVPEEKAVEKPPRKYVKPIKLNRSSSDQPSEPSANLRRQKWGQSHYLAQIASSVEKLDIETLKTVCPSLEFLDENDVNLEPTPKELRRPSLNVERKIERKESTDIKSDDSDKPDYDKQSSVNSSNEQIEPEDNSNIIAMNRKISIVDDTASKLRPPPSPAKHPVSAVLYLTNLVRPFTLKALKELLERTGKIIEEGFWTDRIKSKCYVQYETAEEAETTRNALHGVNWPIGNGKQLMIDYATPEDLEKAKNPPPPPPPPVVVPEKVPEKENKEPERKISESDRRSSRERDEKRRKSEGHVREWDLGKEDLHRKRSRSRTRERTRKVSKRSASPTEDFMARKQRKVEENALKKMMDDLFLKTKATPSVYWQPLSPEEIATKQQQRLLRMEEHKRRMEESSRIRGRNEGRGGSFRRR